MNDFLKQYRQDSKIHSTDLDDAALRNSELHSKYLDIYSDKKRELNKYKSKKKVLYKVLSQYYSGDLNGTDKLNQLRREPFKLKLTKSQINTYVESDELITAIDDKLDDLIVDVDCLLKILEEIKYRVNAIRAAIDDRKFKAGF